MRRAKSLPYNESNVRTVYSRNKRPLMARQNNAKRYRLVLGFIRVATIAAICIPCFQAMTNTLI